VTDKFSFKMNFSIDFDSFIFEYDFIEVVVIPTIDGLITKNVFIIIIVTAYYIIAEIVKFIIMVADYFTGESNNFNIKEVIIMIIIDLAIVKLVKRMTTKEGTIITIRLFCFLY
jgi:hypothetical protein